MILQYVQWTPALAIEKRLEVRETRAARKKEFDAADASDKLKEDLLESYLLSVMAERGEEQIKTDLGVAYKSPQMRVTMADRQAVIDYVLQPLWDCAGIAAIGQELTEVEKRFSLFTNAISKEAVKDLESQQIAVPGITIDRFITCNVRKA